MSEKDSILLDNEYVIMSEVAENENVTQRELSRKLGVSVSTVNVLMNKMIREGLIKMTQVSQKQVLYMLTPVGIIEKAKKTVRYLKAHYRAIFTTKEKIKSVLNKLSKDNDIIYVLIHNDEMSEILSIAVHEFQSKFGQSKIKLIYSTLDIDERAYKSQILLHMTLNEDIFNKDLINQIGDVSKFEIINLAELL